MVELTVISARDPSFIDVEMSGIFMYVRFEEFQDELPFCAVPNDTTAYGPDLYYRALEGEFGPVAPYIPPTELAQPNVSGVQTL